MAVRAREQLGADPRRRALAGAAHRDVLVRNQQRADPAVEVIDAALHELREVVGGFAARGVALRGPEQQLEVAVAHHEAALQVADAALRDQLALQALERRAQQAVHELERARVAARARFAAQDAEPAHQPRVAIPQQEHVGAVLAVDRLGAAVVLRGGVHLARDGFLQRAVQFGRVDPVVQPHRQPHAVVDRDGLRARQQHLHDLPVRVE